MAVVSTLYVGEWNTTNENNTPLGADSRRDGDDEMRMTRGTVKRSFPNVLGAVNASHAELNQLVGVGTTRTVEQRLNDYEQSFPVGTRVLMYQASAPAGWNQVTAEINNRFLRVTSGVGGGTGGSDDPTIMNAVIDHTHNVSMGGAGGHEHDVDMVTGQGGAIAGLFYTGQGTASGSASNAAQMIGDHAHTPATAASPAGAVVSWQPNYFDCILCEKIEVP